MIIRYRTTKAPKGQQTAGRGSCVPSVASQRSWSGTPACGLISPSGFGGIFADNHK